MGDFLENFKSDAKGLLRDKKNLINILVLGILILALPLGIDLIRRQQLLKSRAAAEPIVFAGANVAQRNINGNMEWVILDATKGISLEFTSPLGPPAPPPTAPPPITPPPVTPPPVTPPPGQVPVPPTNPAASCPAPGTTASMSWTGSSGASRYDVYAFDTAFPVDWQTPCGSGGRVLCRQVTSGTSFSFTTTPGKSYQWFVFACNSSGCSSDTGGSFTCTSSTPTVSGPCTGQAAGTCTFDDMVAYYNPDGSRDFAVTAYGKYWNWNSPSRGVFNLTGSGDLTSVSWYMNP